MTPSPSTSDTFSSTAFQTSDNAIPIEYAGQMRAFPQQALWRYRIKINLLSTEKIDRLTEKITHFHYAADVAAHFYLESRMNKDFLTIDQRHPWGESATP